MTWIIFLSIVGIVLICLELFVPGAILGVLGTLCLLAAVIVTYALYGATSGNLALATLLIAGAVAVALWLTLFPKSKGGRLMITQKTLADSKSSESLENLKGCQGFSITPLRPSGAARINDRRVDVVAESGLIDQQTAVIVVRVEGSRVVVRKISA